MLDACAIGWEKRDGMVYLVNAQQSRVADPVADARVAHFRPERFVANRVSSAQADMTEASDAGVARTVVASVAHGGTPSNLDWIAAGIGEADEVAHHARVGLLASAYVHSMAKLLQLGCRLVEIFLICNLEARNLNVRITVNIA